MPSKPSTRRSTTSLYLDDVDVSVLNGALHRAIGGEPGRASDLIVFLQEQLGRIVEADPHLADGYSESLTKVSERIWWHLPNEALHADVTGYAEAWNQVKAVWGPASHAPVGADLIALSALTHRPAAWREEPLPRDRVPYFPFRPMPAPSTQRSRPADGPSPAPRLGQYPRPPQRGRPQHEDRTITKPRPTYAVFKRNQLVFTGKKTGSSLSVATDPHLHQLTRTLIGPAVLEWLLRHWARRFRSWKVARWADAPLHAAMHAADSRDYRWMPEALDELEWNLEAHAENRHDGVDKYGERIVTPPGRTRAERLAEAFDVAFEDVIDLGGYFLNDIDTPLPHLGVVVMAKRLGLLGDFDEANFDADGFGERFRAALAVTEDADHATWRDAALRTLTDDVTPIDALPRYGAAAVHADAILHAYLRERSHGAAPTTLFGLLGRGQPTAWPERWALQRFLGIDVGLAWANVGGTTRSGVDLSTVQPELWPRVNAVLELVGRPAEGTGYGPFYAGTRSDRPPRGTYALDTAFVEEVLRVARSNLPTTKAAASLVDWMKRRAKPSNEEDAKEGADG